MRRLFLSGQMTCAMLLGAGLLLRAQSALRPDPPPHAAYEEPRTRPAELMGDHARPAPKIVRNQLPAAPRDVQKSSHTRKDSGKRAASLRAAKCGSALAGRSVRCGQGGGQ